MLRVNCDTDESDSQLLPTLDSDGDFSDCLYSDQFKQGLRSVCNLRVGNLDKERVLWYSREYQDWNINEGLEAKPEEVLAFGSDSSTDAGAQEPIYPGAGTWWVVRRPGLRTSLEVRSCD
ncbi:hypothetical protein WJX75_006641 [Coccomyxa subellipsoidea]|uniref:Uncharacterized protein n=1 Tax=Coccomyxa subellipsoidea TaxID=248742 RepID=A0ABR2YI00_9CHLO